MCFKSLFLQSRREGRSYPIFYVYTMCNNWKLEGRDLFKFSLGIRARNSLSSSPSLCKDQTTYTHFASQDLHVSTL